jgi:hypothetical protein
MSRGVNDVQILQSLYGPGLLNLVNTAIVYVAVVALLLRIDPPAHRGVAVAVPALCTSG